MNILHQELPSFQKSIYQLLQKFDQDRLLQIIVDEKEDNRGKTVEFLQNLYDNILKW